MFSKIANKLRWLIFHLLRREVCINKIGITWTFFFRSFCHFDLVPLWDVDFDFTQSNHANVGTISGQLLHRPFAFFFFSYLLQHLDFIFLFFFPEQSFSQPPHELLFASSRIVKSEFMSSSTFHPQNGQAIHPTFIVLWHCLHRLIGLPTKGSKLGHPKSFSIP